MSPSPSPSASPGERGRLLSPDRDPACPSTVVGPRGPPDPSPEPQAPAAAAADFAATTPAPDSPRGQPLIVSDESISAGVSPFNPEQGQLQPAVSPVRLSFSPAREATSSSEPHPSLATAVEVEVGGAGGAGGAGPGVQVKDDDLNFSAVVGKAKALLGGPDAAAAPCGPRDQSSGLDGVTKALQNSLMAARVAISHFVAKLISWR
eukprot:tig00020538_g10334.t1